MTSILDKRHQTIDRFLVFMLIAVSVFDYFIRDMEYTAFTYVISLIVILSRKIKIDKLFFYYILLFVAIIVLQAIKFDYFSMRTSIGILSKISLAYFVVKITGQNFIKIFTNIVYKFAVLALVVWVISILFPSFPIFMMNNVTPNIVIPFPKGEDLFGFELAYKNMIVYNFQDIEKFRNSGPYWEPGVNAGISIIALMFNLVSDKSLFTNKNKVMILNILTTLSTTGYLALMVLVIVHYFINKSIIKKMFVLPFLIIISFFVFTSMDFLVEKITFQINETDELFVGNTLVKHPNRFASALVDFYDFIKNPLIGKGRNVNTRIDNFGNTTNFDVIHRNNGTTDLLVSFGIFVFAIYFYFIRNSFISFCKKYKFNTNISIYFVIIIGILGFSEPYFTRPLFFAFNFLFFTYKDEGNI